MKNLNNTVDSKSQKERDILITAIVVGIITIARPNLHSLHLNEINLNHDKIINKNSIDNAKKEPALNSGIDVSHFQGEINWQEVTQQKIDFVFLKSTQGDNFLDPTYQQHKSDLTKMNIPFGSYHFFEPDIDPTVQAEFYLKNTGVKHILPPVVDIEINSGIDSNEIQARLTIWLKKVEQATNCKPIIYTNRYYWNEYLSSEFNAYPLWISDYATDIQLPNNVNSWVFWQNSQSFKLNGIQNSVDHDLANVKQTITTDLFCP